MEYEVMNPLNISYPRQAEGQLTPKGMDGDKSIHHGPVM